MYVGIQYEQTHKTKTVIGKAKYFKEPHVCVVNLYN